MNQLTADQIATALGGRPGAPGPELRLLMLYQPEAGDRVATEPTSIGEPLPKAA
jgi:hypothetical protein